MYFKHLVGTLLWRHNDRDGISNHQPHHCLPNRLFRRRSKKTSKLRITGLCVGNSPVTSEFPAQRASDAEKVSIWWCHHDIYADIRWAIILQTNPKGEIAIVHAIRMQNPFHFITNWWKIIAYRICRVFERKPGLSRQITLTSCIQYYSRDWYFQR